MNNELHCKSCEHGKETTDQGRHCGWSCQHSEIKALPGLMYGRYHKSETKYPTWCPVRII